MTTPYPPYLPNPQYIDSQFNESNYYDNESIVHHRIYYTFLCALFVVDVETPHHIYSSPAGWRIITSRPSPQSCRLINQSTPAVSNNRHYYTCLICRHSIIRYNKGNQSDGPCMLTPGQMVGKGKLQHRQIISNSIVM